jgi:hypothetical protein
LAIVRVLADLPLRGLMARSGQATASHYAWPEIADRVLAVYERALRSASAPRLSRVG